MVVGIFAGGAVRQGRACVDELGRLSHQSRRTLAFFAKLELRLQRLADRALRDQTPFDVRTRWDLKHRVEERLLDDRLEGARTSPSKERKLRDRITTSL